MIRGGPTSISGLRCRRASKDILCKTSASQKLSIWNLAIVTANVLTMNCDKERSILQQSLRMEAIQSQCVDAGLDVVGIQESRARQEGTFDTAEYKV